MARRRFNSEKSANDFAKKVSGNVNDLRNNENAKSNFTVTYKPKFKNSINDNNDWCPEEDRDFGYPNDYWE